MAATDLQLRVTVGKLIELAYSTNEGPTARIVKSGNNFRISVDHTGKAKLSGGGESVFFYGEPAMSGLGISISRVSILFTNGDGWNLNYSATFTLVGSSSISLMGSFNIEELLLSCSGWLCEAARLLKGRNAKIEQQLQQIMGR
ncbi:hypothetical protein [Saccharospirillum salsuginis]|uniref:Uncharacterized protein n=1 Tax=Saccharospirillum salsuginis TaxID=418750 RepID=A0A918NAW7_9GAMM|nr:hypothetical protein [Saccharospirillum salsuginis]GGX54551.1 hypothetical protein GCM10007392_22440 [Saccharospirillum salsuginis]